MPFLSVIIPAYNEANLIAETIERSCEYLSGHFPDTELLIVDDGSSDETAAIVSEIIAVRDGEISIRLITNDRNRGKGYSIRNGIEHAAGQNILFFDADLPYDLNSIPEMVAGLQSGYDIVVGSRTQAGSIIAADIPLIRRLASRVFRAIVHRLIDLDVEDTQCGFKGFSSQAAKAIFSRITTEGFGFDFEALVLARKLGYRIHPIPVIMLKTRHASRIKLARDAFRMFGDILRVAWNTRSAKLQSARHAGEP